MAQKIRDAEGIFRSLPPAGTPIVPKEGETNILITSALPYCNNVPHLGNIIGSLLSADVFSRYSRTRNQRTLYVCGTDEYGTATETQALKEGITAKELCDKYHALHRETYKWFDIEFDYFGRTSTPWHTKVCQDVYANLLRNDMLVKQVKAQTFCENCNKFLADRFVEGTCPHCGADDARGDQCDVCSRTLDAVELVNPRCLINKMHTVVHRDSGHMYIKLDTLQPRTEEWIKKSYRLGQWSANATINTDGQITDARLKDGLRPSPITRDLQWGVPIPDVDGHDDQGMKGKVLYVWFDAPLGYPSITANFLPEQWEQWWFNPKNVKLFQFMGKDNVYFHTILFPSMLLGDGRDWTLLHHINTTEYLNYEGGKFSKSHNRGVFGPAAKETGIPPSVWRYYLLSTRPETQDSQFSWDDCIAANNNVLLKNFGNFVNRVLKFISSQYGGVVPEGPDTPGPLSPNDSDDAEFISEVNALLKEYIAVMDLSKLRTGLQLVMHLSARGNLYLQSSGLDKALLAERPERCAQVVTRALNLIYLLSALVHPFMPATSSAMLEQLNAPERAVPNVLAIDILAGHTIGKPDHLFKNIDPKNADVWRAKFAGNSPEKADAAALKADATHAAPGMSKRKAEAAKKAAQKAAVADTVAAPKSAEALAKEQEVAEQGNVVRELKSQTPKDDAAISVAVDKLKVLKVELAELLKQ